MRKDEEEEEEDDEDEKEKEEDEEEKVTLIKSRDPHLAGGENQLNILNRKHHQLHQFGASQRNKPIALGHSEAFSQTLMRVLYAVPRMKIQKES